VGCSVKKKLIADNFSSVWDSFWNDLIESEEQSGAIKQIENDIGATDADQGEGDVNEINNAPEDDEDSPSSSPVCLNGALTTCNKMYDLTEDWNASSYYPLAYSGVFYNLDPAQQQYGFNNEYYYNLENLEINGTATDFFGFKCMKYNGDDEHPILYLGGRSTTTPVSAVFELNLQTKKIKPILVADDDDSEFLCIDMIGKKHLLIGGKGFTNVIKYIDGRATTGLQTAIPLIIMNTETYDVTLLYDATTTPRIINPIPGQTKVNKICVCKNKKVINENEKTSYHEYVGLFGGNIQIATAGGATPNIINIGCVVIKITINNSNPAVVAKMCCIDKNVEDGTTTNVIRGFELLPPAEDQIVNVTSIVCDEEEESSTAKNKTTFYVGGYFNTFSYVDDYDRFEKAQAIAAAGGPAVILNNFIKNGKCNSILKVSITTTYKNPNYQNQCTFEPIETNAEDLVFHASLALHKANSNNYLLAFTACVDKMSIDPVNNRVIRTNLNVFNVKKRVNAQIVIPTPNSRSGSAAIIKTEYVHQCFTIVEDVQSKKHIAVMSYTVNRREINGYSFTCELNMEARVPLRVVESTCNNEEVTRQNNSVTDVCGIKNNNGNQIDLYIVRENVTIIREKQNQILYPLTVKSNYQQIGSWNMATATMTNDESSESESDISKEIETFFRFVDSVMELSKIYKKYPSTMLFLQNIDYRDKNEKITENYLQKMHAELMLKTSMNSVSASKKVKIEKSCNDVFLNLNKMLDIWSTMISNTTLFVTPSGLDEREINEILFLKIKSFYDSFIFLLIYAGCINLAQLLCNNYTVSVLSNANGLPDSPDYFLLNKMNIKSKFMTVFTTVGGFGYEDINNKFKEMFSEKAQRYDKTFPNIRICSNSETHTGIAHIMHGVSGQLDMLINSETKQKALQNKIYKSDETFFIENSDFFKTVMADDSINTIDRIEFCSFYKFQQHIHLFRTNVGGMIDTTVYASINIDSDVKIDSSKVLDFLKLIIDYFKRLPGPPPVIDTGIGGPVNRIIFGGDFGCNLLHDTSVCSQFSKHGMKIYTMPNNSNAFVDSKNVSGNQMFVVDANVMNLLPPSVGGGENAKPKQRLKIGDPIQSNYNYADDQTKLVIVNHKKKTRRRYK
jgi:hypothetical protein